MRSTLRSFFYNLKNGLSNIIEYFNIVWYDRDWDYSYIDRLLRFKLNKMANKMEKYDQHTSKDATVKQLRFCVKLLDRLIADDYIHPDFEKTFSERSTNDILTGKNKNFTDEDFSNWMKYESYLREKDRCVLENIIKKHMTGWWY